MKKVITFGVFDYFHYGHLLLLEQAKALGDYLIVAIQEDDSIFKYKSNEKIFYSTNQRMHMIKSLKLVDKVVSYREVDKDIINNDFDILVVGEDQNHEGFSKAIKWCEEHQKDVIRLCRTKEISSTIIKNKKTLI